VRRGAFLPLWCQLDAVRTAFGSGFASVLGELVETAGNDCEWTGCSHQVDPFGSTGEVTSAG